MTAVSTIFALSSAPGRAGVAVIRISGPAVRDVLRTMAHPAVTDRQAAFRRIRHPQNGDEIDRAVVLFFASPKSETGEDVAEFQVHGGPAVIRAVLDALARVQGCRMAEAGEFARRAFQNGKIDLAEAEGLADLIEAETEDQRRQALRQASGHLSALTDGWRERLIACAALVEAGIDFSDEGDVAADAFAQARRQAIPLRDEIRAALDDGHRGEILRDGFRIVLAGAPNVGKSSLLNALARRDAAIVSPEPGTTRDTIEVRLDLGGLPIVITDTAGLRATTGAVEQEGVRRTLRSAAAADLVVWVVEAAAPEDPSVPRASPGDTTEAPPAQGLRIDPGRLLIAANKADLTPAAPRPVGVDIAVSALTGAGIPELVRLLAERARARLITHPGGVTAPAVVTQARHRHLLEACCDHLDAFLAGTDDAPELRAEDVRSAASALGRITGRIDAEDVLDAVFGRFCIGK